MEKEEYKGVWIFAEQREGALQKVSLQILGKGRELADELGVELTAVLPGEGIKGLAGELFAHGADRVLAVEHAFLKNYTTDAYTKVVCELVNERKPEIFIIGATNIGRDLGPRVAARLETGLTADCTGLALCPDTANLLMTRPAFGGNLMATIICQEHRPQMSTVRPGVFEIPQGCRTGKGILEEIIPDLMPEDIRTDIVEIAKAAKQVVDIGEAKILVSGGRGVGCKENFSLLYDLADELNGVVSGSRAAVDAGWIDKAYQVGQTGKTVRPQVYIACGISGAIQHLAGMQESDYIIAINKQIDAPIMQVANSAVVGDMHKVIPELIAKIKEIKSMETTC
ncbi:electron transfer flavoprotein subunit alpha/FixB family protein [Christensenella timonensis]|uniref:electron transfer flavoprotein subunit alpha/FixB family protein n=1 Tax=Christensenella timonensis TaxID=1816678 RepID=UPI00082C54D6|nr:electron transfer flavoprotein subunit alpha/FixB family protein [Christensenella timonensis]